MALRANTWAPAAGGAVAVLLLLLVGSTGLPGLAAIAVLLAGALLVARPRIALVVLAFTVIFADLNGVLGVETTARVYEPVAGAKLTPMEAVTLLAAAAAVLRAMTRGWFAGVGPFTGPLLLILAGVLAGYITGKTGHGTQIFNGARSILPLVVVPVIAANVVEDEDDLRLALAGLAAAVVAKAVLGLAGLALGLNALFTVGTAHATYLESVPNFLCVLFLLAVLAAVAMRQKLPWWVLSSSPVVFLCLLLSYRRSWWLAIVGAALLVVLVGSGRIGRRLLVPAALALVVGVGLVLATGAVRAPVDGAVAQRIESLRPTSITASSDDRYRIGERRNVWAELKEHPVSGLGLGVGWIERYPLSEEHTDGGLYVHFAALWWWMKLGILGLVAYLVLYVTTAVVGLRVFLRARGNLLGVAGLAMAGGIVALGMVETTATFTGSEVRMSTVLGLLVGLLAVTDRLARTGPATLDRTPVH